MKLNSVNSVFHKVGFFVVIIVSLLSGCSSKIADRDYLMSISLNTVKEGLLDPDSLIVYDGFVEAYDADYVNLQYVEEDDAIPEPYNQDVWNVYIHYGAKNGMGGITESAMGFIYNTNCEQIYKEPISLSSKDGSATLDMQTNGDNENDDSFLKKEVIQIKNDETRDKQEYSSEDIKKILKMKIIKGKADTTSTWPEYTDEDKQKRLFFLVQTSLNSGHQIVAERLLDSITDPELLEKGNELLSVYYYDSANKEWNNDEFILAYWDYLRAGDYKDSLEKCKEAQYLGAFQFMARQDYTMALNFYEELGDYKDSAQWKEELEKMIEKRDLDKQYKEIVYNLQEGKIDGAKQFFEQHPDYDQKGFAKLIKKAEQEGICGSWINTNTDSNNKYLWIQPYISSSPKLYFEYTERETKDGYSSWLDIEKKDSDFFSYQSKGITFKYDKNSDTLLRQEGDLTETYNRDK